MFKQKTRENSIQLQFFDEANTTLLTHHLKSCPLAAVSVHVQPCYHKL